MTGWEKSRAGMRSFLGIAHGRRHIIGGIWLAFRASQRVENYHMTILYRQIPLGPIIEQEMGQGH